LHLPTGHQATIMAALSPKVLFIAFCSHNSLGDNLDVVIANETLDTLIIVSACMLHRYRPLKSSPEHMIEFSLSSCLHARTHARTQARIMLKFLRESWLLCNHNVHANVMNNSPKAKKKKAIQRTLKTTKIMPYPSQVVN